MQGVTKKEIISAYEKLCALEGGEKNNNVRRVWTKKDFSGESEKKKKKKNFEGQG